MLSSQTYSKLSSTAKFQLCSRWSRASVHRILEILRGVTALDKKSGREWGSTILDTWSERFFLMGKYMMLYIKVTKQLY